MIEALKKRISELEEQARAGARMIAEQEAQLASTRATMLRIEGALAVLRELAGLRDHPTSMSGDRATPEPAP